MPIGAGPSFHGIADLLTDKAYIYDSGAAEETQIPEEMEDQEAEVHEQLVEGIVVADDDMLEQYLDGNVPSPAELEVVLGRGVADGSVFPVVCGSATGPIAVDRLANFLVEIGPAPTSRAMTVTMSDIDSEPACDPNGDQLACVFKTISDDYVGQISLFRVLSGTINRDDNLTNSTSGDSERLRGLVSLVGGSQQDIDGISAGDIGGVTKLQQTRTGDTLTNAGRAVVQMEPWPEPVLAYGLVPKTRAAEDKLGTGLRRLTDEDPSLLLERSEEDPSDPAMGVGRGPSPAGHCPSRPDGHRGGGPKTCGSPIAKPSPATGTPRASTRSSPAGTGSSGWPTCGSSRCPGAAASSSWTPSPAARFPGRTFPPWRPASATPWPTGAIWDSPSWM